MQKETLILLSGFFGFFFMNSMAKADQENTEKVTVCNDPRPQVCTMDYRPVCAQLEDGSIKTYSNGCTACSDQLVTDYEEGVCKNMNKREE